MAAFTAGLPTVAEDMGPTAKSNGLKGFKPLKVKRIRIEIGTERPFRAFHLSDTHIVRADATEKDPRKVEHVPFYTPKHYARNMKNTKGVCSYLAGTPDDLVDTWGGRHDFPEGQEWRDRAVQQRADAPTKEFVKPEISASRQGRPDRSLSRILGGAHYSDGHPVHGISDLQGRMHHH